MKENNLLKDRAWIEIDLDNLVNNISEIKKIISPKTKIMAVVKANAYGHGALLIARKLSEILNINRPKITKILKKME